MNRVPYSVYICTTLVTEHQNCQPTLKGFIEIKKLYSQVEQIAHLSIIEAKAAYLREVVYRCDENSEILITVLVDQVEIAMVFVPFNKADESLSIKKAVDSPSFQNAYDSICLKMYRHILKILETGEKQK